MGVEVLLGDEGEEAKVGKLLQVVRMHAARRALGAVDRHGGVGAAQRTSQTLRLQAAQLIDACRFDRVEADWACDFIRPLAIRLTAQAAP